MRRGPPDGARAGIRLPGLRRGRRARGDRVRGVALPDRPRPDLRHRRLDGRRRHVVPRVPLPRPVRCRRAVLRLRRPSTVGEARRLDLPDARLGRAVVAVSIGGAAGREPRAHARPDRSRRVGSRDRRRGQRGALAPDGTPPPRSWPRRGLHRAAADGTQRPRARGVGAGRGLAARPAEAPRSRARRARHRHAAPQPVGVASDRSTGSVRPARCDRGRVRSGGPGRADG